MLEAVPLDLDAAVSLQKQGKYQESLESGKSMCTNWIGHTTWSIGGELSRKFQESCNRGLVHPRHEGLWWGNVQWRSSLSQGKPPVIQPGFNPEFSLQVWFKYSHSAKKNEKNIYPFFIWVVYYILNYDSPNCIFKSLWVGRRLLSSCCGVWRCGWTPETRSSLNGISTNQLRIYFFLQGI